MRLDKFLKVSRVIKRRTVANEACDNGRVSINGRQAKAGTAVKPGDVVKVEFAGGSTEFEILSVEENVKKANAAEMYRIITSVILAVFISVGAITGFSGCRKETEHKAGTSYVMTVDGMKVYNEQFNYLFAMEAQELAGADYSASWLDENMNAVIEAAGQRAASMTALYNKAMEEGYDLTLAEIYDLKTNISSVLEYNLQLNEDKNISTKDDICYYLTGMNVEEYVRFSVFKSVADKYLNMLMEGYEPDESQQREYYEANIEKFKAYSIGKIYIKDEASAKEAYNLLINGVYDFETVAKGWSQDSNVLENGGIEVVTAKPGILPAKVMSYIFSCEEPVKEYEMIYSEGSGYYIVNVREILDYDSCQPLRDYVLETMTKEEQDKRIAPIAEGASVSFNEKEAVNGAKKFLEDRVI